MSLEQVRQTLLRSKEPSVRWMVRVHVLEENRRSKRIQGLGRQIRLCPRVRTLLAHRDLGGRLRPVGNPYSKWQGAHWVLATLADIGYPRADRSLFAMRDQVLDRWLADTYYHEFDAKTEAEAYRGVGVPRIRRRYRRCASQQGNALYFLTKTWYRGWAHGRPRRATTTLAVARRRLELRQALQRRHILVLGIPPPDARACASFDPDEESRGEGSGDARRGSIPEPPPFHRETQWSRHEPGVPPSPLSALPRV